MVHMVHIYVFTINSIQINRLQGLETGTQTGTHMVHMVHTGADRGQRANVRGQCTTYCVLKGLLRWELLVRCYLSTDRGQRATGNGQRATGNGQRATDRGQWARTLARWRRAARRRPPRNKSSAVW